MVKFEAIIFILYLKCYSKIGLTSYSFVSFKAVTFLSALAREITAFPAFIPSHTLLKTPVCSVLPSAPHALPHFNALRVGRVSILKQGNACYAKKIARCVHLLFVFTAL